MKTTVILTLAVMMAGQGTAQAADTTEFPGHNGEYVWTEQGVVHGRPSGAVTEFLGLPFAAPPVGDLRWKAPAPAAHWSGVRDGTAPGNICVQPTVDASGNSTIGGSEDCLYLNVYRPAVVQAGQLLPVMLFVHGGSNLKQAATNYDPSAIVETTGVIVVTTNYRLNVFGFLALPSLDAEAGDTSSGNFGLLDQQAAMRWIHSNILRFGGDPANMTVAGESSGAIDLCANLVSPAAAGLFRKAILESMYCPTATHEEALTVSAPVAAKLNCTDVQMQASCMRSVAAEDVLTAAAPLSFVVGGGSGFNASPNFGNPLLPLAPAQAISSGQWNRSRILVGSNHDEAALFVAAGLLQLPGQNFPPAKALYAGLVNRSFGPLAPDVMNNEYPLTDFPNTFIAYSDEVTDPSPLGCEVSQWSDTFSLAAGTCRYEFSEPSPPVPNGMNTPPGFSIGAYHGSELQFLFNTTIMPGPQTDAQRQLADEMIRYWGNFVKTGNPNGPGLAPWPRYEPSGRRILSLSTSGNAVIDNFDDDHRCAFWASNPSHGPLVQATR
jgi:para-nitrobenzyl esterase